MGFALEFTDEEDAFLTYCNEMNILWPGTESPEFERWKMLNQSDTIPCPESASASPPRQSSPPRSASTTPYRPDCDRRGKPRSQ